MHRIGDAFDQVIRRLCRAKHFETIVRVIHGDLRRCPRVIGVWRVTPPLSFLQMSRKPLPATGDKVTKLEQQMSELKAALARKKAFEAGEPVPSIVRARKPKPRW